MLYCEECREKHKWPKTFMASFGTCEECFRTRSCYDLPAHILFGNKPVCEGTEAAVCEDIHQPDDDEPVDAKWFNDLCGELILQANYTIYPDRHILKIESGDEAFEISKPNKYLPFTRGKVRQLLRAFQ